MSDHTAISWTDATWNPVTGCNRVSEGCDHCFAEALTRRFPARFPNGFAVTLHPERLDQPARWWAPRRIFVNSMSDLFHPRVPDDFLQQVWWAMLNEPHHQFQILTKRPVRMLRAVQRLSLPLWAHIWLGVSAENQRWADVRIPPLLWLPTPSLFLSAEPLLGPIHLSDEALVCLRWVIVGGESGIWHRPMDLDWARSLRDQCVAAEVPFHLKQLGGVRPGGPALLDGRQWREMPEPGI